MEHLVFFKSSTKEQKPDALSSPPPKKTKKDYGKKYDLLNALELFKKLGSQIFNGYQLMIIKLLPVAEPQSDEVHILD
ncbi:hypothetical protein DPMN_138180 [Dreissena polymorpha]|uniref:Uncharacterized protein n=1 Tax=Dreissena polymorpha TaxID=45954 RepID=A0A9D4G3B3_DREPO|nr:hypothetical protein DPMN_138180 [Dreissena polymorpha]